MTEEHSLAERLAAIEAKEVSIEKQTEETSRKLDKLAEAINLLNSGSLSDLNTKFQLLRQDVSAIKEKLENLTEATQTKASRDDLNDTMELAEQNRIKLVAMESELLLIQSWRLSIVKWFWIAATAISGLLAQAAYKLFGGH